MLFNELTTLFLRISFGIFTFTEQFLTVMKADRKWGRPTDHPVYKFLLTIVFTRVLPIECDVSAVDAEHSEPLTGATLTPHYTVPRPFDHSASHSVQNAEHPFLCSHHPSICATCCWLPAQQHHVANGPVNQSPSEPPVARTTPTQAKGSAHPFCTRPRTVHMNPCIWKLTLKAWKHVMSVKSVSQML